MATINDIVLIFLEDAPISFARIESILPDHKKDWFQIKLLMLQIPLQAVTWILKDDYINGQEFQMNQKRMRLEKIVCPVEPELSMPPEEQEHDVESSGPNRQAVLPDPDGPDKGRVISFSDFKKKNT